MSARWLPGPLDEGEPEEPWTAAEVLAVALVVTALAIGLCDLFLSNPFCGGFVR